MRGIDPRIAFDPATRTSYVSWAGNHNAGDDAMLRVASRALGLSFEVHHRPRRTERAGGTVVLGGGTLIGRDAALSGYLAVLERLVRGARSFHVFGTGVSENIVGLPSSHVEAWVALLEHAESLLVRGPLSERLLRTAGVGAPIAVIGDLGLSFLPGDTQDDRRGTQLHVAVNLTPHFGGWPVEARQVLVDSLQSLQRASVRISLIAMTPDDLVPLTFVRAQLDGDAQLLPAYSHARSLDILCRCDLVISQRLHGSILAAATRTPFLALSYAGKHDDFLESVSAGPGSSWRSSDTSGELMDRCEALLADGLDDRMLERIAQLQARQGEHLHDLRGQLETVAPSEMGDAHA